MPPFPLAVCAEAETAGLFLFRLTSAPHFWFENAYWTGEDCSELCTAQIRKIAYIAPQNSDVGFGTEFADDVVGRDGSVVCGQEQQSGRAAADRPRQAPV